MPNPPEERGSKAEVPKPKNPRGRSLNLGDFFESDLFKLLIESREAPDERDARLNRERAEAEHERHKEIMILRAVLTTVGIALLVCIVVIVMPGSPPENAKWATTLLTTIVSAGVGYLTGKSSKPST
jgi:hypothetical protein